MKKSRLFKGFAPIGQVGAGQRVEMDYMHPYSKTKSDKGKAKRQTGKKLDRKARVSNDVELFTTGKLEIDRSLNDEGMGYATMKDIYDFFGTIKWSWQNYIPVGHLIMIAGVQGQGKSYFAAYIMAVLTGTKQEWPDGTTYRGKTGKAMLIDTEQMRGEYVTRLRLMGVKDKDVIFPILNTEREDMTYTVDLISELPDIEKLATRTKSVGIIIDSLTGGHSINENSSEMKMILQPLSDMAARLQIPVIVIHDLRKRDIRESTKATLEKVRGSVVITKFCRSVMGLYRPGENFNSTVRIDMLKTNFCKIPKSLGFNIGNNGLTFGEAPEVTKSITASDIAADFLMETLANGPVKIKTIRAKANEEGITTYALYEARNRLGIVAIKGSWKLRTINGKPYPVPNKAMN